jgi:hypothetical protein
MRAHEPSRIQWVRSRDAGTTIFHSYAYCVLSDIAQTFHAMKAHIHTLKVVLIKMLSRYKDYFSADRRKILVFHKFNATVDEFLFVLNIIFEVSLNGTKIIPVKPD